MREFWHDHFSFYTLERKSYAQSRASQFRLIKLLLLRAVGDQREDTKICIVDIDSAYSNHHLVSHCEATAAVATAIRALYCVATASL